MGNKIALIDGDAIFYILAWQFKDKQAEGDDYDEMLGAIDQMVIGILQATDCKYFLGALGHQYQKCFRYSIAKYKPYKGTRKEEDDWVKIWKPVIRKRLEEQWNFISIAGLEADDVIAIAAQEFDSRHKQGQADYSYVICSPDKDLWQIPGMHYDYRKQDFADISPLQADYFFAYQMLVGDTSDNVAGLPGFGEKKAKEKLKEATDAHQFYEHAVRVLYLKYFGEYYGSIIFEENKAVLGLVNKAHTQYNELHAAIITGSVQQKEIQDSQNDVLAKLGWG